MLDREKRLIIPRERQGSLAEQPSFRALQRDGWQVANAYLDPRRDCFHVILHAPQDEPAPADRAC